MTISEQEAESLILDLAEALRGAVSEYQWAVAKGKHDNERAPDWYDKALAVLARLGK